MGVPGKVMSLLLVMRARSLTCSRKQAMVIGEEVSLPTVEF